METSKKTVFYDKLTFIYLEMPKFKKTEGELETMFDKWMFTLKNLPNLMNRPPELQERIFKKLFKISELSQLKHSEYLDYEDSLKVYRDNQNVLDSAENTGFKQGLAKGIEAGIKEGIDEGKKEIALKAIKRGMDIQDIAEITGLEIKLIKELVSNNNSTNS